MPPLSKTPAMVPETWDPCPWSSFGLVSSLTKSYPSMISGKSVWVELFPVSITTTFTPVPFSYGNTTSASMWSTPHTVEYSPPAEGEWPWVVAIRSSSM